MNGNLLPVCSQNPSDLDLAARFAPIVLADELEPFDLLLAGYTIFEQEGDSPSFVPPRRVEWIAPRYPAHRAIEYALWWDWDIGHLYELEHVWAFVNQEDQVIAVEASWHGMYGPIEIDGRPPLEGTHPVVLAQPGKHAMAATAGPFEEIREWAESSAGPEAGKEGVLETELFRGRLGKTPERDALATAYLKRRAFVPSWKFTRRFAVTREMLVPWDVLRDWIPARVGWWIEELGRGRQ